MRCQPLRRSSPCQPHCPTRSRRLCQRVGQRLAKTRARASGVVVAGERVGGGRAGGGAGGGAGTNPTVVSAGVLNGQAASLPKPAYPSVAKAARVAGPVIVQVIIDESGNVISANAVGGNPLLHAAAVASARQAKFTPTKLSGKPVKE